jgi:protein-S-isoprenylcysteine O-methyltransferase Ste14
MKNILKYQGYHLVIYVILGLTVFEYSNRINLPYSETIFSYNVHEWLIISIILAGIHQIWVLLFYRLELFYGRISKIFGKSGFLIYSFGFGLFGLSRFLGLIFVAQLSSDTLTLKPSIANIIILILVPFVLWTFYSVKTYFGIKRALGADHFDSKYRGSPLEKRGIFKYISNSMYGVGLLILYFPGLWYLSSIGLILGLFHYLLVWTHYFCTEKPDMKKIYGKSN